MINLTPAQRRALKIRAHHLRPVVMIGDAGLTPTVLHEIDINLKSHELIKVRVLDNDRTARAGLINAICAPLDAVAVQHIGKILVLFRPRPDTGTTAGEKPETRAGKKSTGKPAARSRTGKTPHRTKRSFQS